MDGSIIVNTLASNNGINSLLDIKSIYEIRIENNSFTNMLQNHTILIRDIPCTTGLI